MKEYKAIVYNSGTCRWYNSKGQLHREDGPALEFADGDKWWYLNNKRHREDGPAVKSADGYKAWYLNGKLHRKDGPAVEYTNGSKEWYLNGKKLTRKEFNKRIDGKELTVAEVERLLGHKVKIVK